MISPRILEQFTVLVAHGHFGRAAEALGISQPALTKGIQRLEGELGVELIDRKSGKAVPTRYGEILLRRGRTLLSAERDLREEIISAAGGSRGVLAVSLGPYPSMLSGYAALSQFISRHPGVTTRLHVSGWREVARQVADRDVDLGIAELSTLQGLAEFATEPIAQHRGYFVCRHGHPLTTEKHLTVEHLVDFPWIAPRFPPRIASVMPDGTRRAGSIDLANGDFVPAIEVDVPMQLGTLVKHSDAIALCALTMLKDDLLDGSITVVPVNSLPLAAGYGFITLRDRTLPRSALGFMDIVRTVEKSIAEQEIELAERLGIQAPPDSAR